MMDYCGYEMFLSGFANAQSEDQLYEQLERCCRNLGFEKFAMGHHVNFNGPPEDAIRLTNYHPDWIERTLVHNLYRDDPVHHASMKGATAFMWSRIPQMISLTPRQMAILEAARNYGLGFGFTVPVNVPGEYCGTCSFGTSSMDALRPDALMLAQWFVPHAFDAARAIMQRRNKAHQNLILRPSLTDRQHDALVLMCRGKSDAEIGYLLGISHSTVHTHVENIRRAYGNAQRAYLIVRALFDGQVSFAEVFRR